eukprot:CAMPEP_0172435138 /NCGR_PEP_ID=MMETSP1064-20121228/71012_1 /TAXON_ID=202472 /ORGANISM="Aulacoseira subarctica , Strain CCAP 1002/5" /LENGTH=309 /DNA_ID=CAMNT_0013183419 /DNA_START=164 /DNA_END=1090 /DNA_ORIENTATION=+
MKMMMHCHSGVEKGIKKGGNPVEVMGLCMGRPDTQDTTILIVTDVFPLPIEGFETRVIADDQNVVNYMIQLQESSEKMRKEKFMGWYHSHPFDVGKYSNCFLSSTDLSTQLQWQRSEDGHGNPFLAMVIDPLRSLAKNTPVLEAFRAYPPEYNSPIANECPDGTIALDESARLERWGSCWQRYYTLSVEYFMSQQSRRIMESLTKNFLWIRTLGSTPVLLEGEYVEQYPERVNALAEKIRVVSSAAPERRRIVAGKEKESNELDNICQGVVELANEKIHGNIVQVAKKNLNDCKNISGRIGRVSRIVHW